MGLDPDDGKAKGHSKSPAKSKTIGRPTHAPRAKDENKLEAYVHSIPTDKLGELLVSASKKGEKEIIKTIEAICPYEKGNKSLAKYKADAHLLGKAFNDAVTQRSKLSQPNLIKEMKPVYDAILKVATDHGGTRGQGTTKEGARSLGSEMIEGKGKYAVSNATKKLITKLDPNLGRT
jgi:hypothetical protein